MNSKIPHCGLYILLGSIPCIARMKCLKWWQIEAVSESLLVRQGWGWPLKYVWLPITSTQESERSFKRFSRQACSMNNVHLLFEGMTLLQYGSILTKMLPYFGKIDISRSFLQRQKVITSKSSSKNLGNVSQLYIFIHFLSWKQQKLRFFDV